MTSQRRTEDLIRDLAARPAPPSLSATATLGWMAGVAAGVLVLFWLIFGLRADLQNAVRHVPVLAKSVLPFGLFAIAGWLAVTSARPGATLRIWALMVPLALALALIFGRLAFGAEGPLLAEMVGGTALACLGSITVMSILPTVAGLILLRRGASTRPGLSGALLGLAAGAGIAAGYALHCTEDSPLFFVVWYGLAMAISAALGAVMGRRFLRW